MFASPRAACQTAAIVAACLLIAAWGCAPEGETGRVSGPADVDGIKLSGVDSPAAALQDATPAEAPRQTASVAEFKHRPGSPEVSLQPGEGNRPSRFAVTGLPAPILAALAAKPSIDEDSRLFAVYVDNDDLNPEDAPQVLGAIKVDGESLCFEPRFSLLPGTSYRVEFDPALLPQGAAAAQGAGDGIGLALLEPIVAYIDVPKREARPTARIDSVYPTAEVLPENQLKFYIHFSAPMSRGKSYDHVHLLKADGTEVKDVFLELPEELWNADGTRFTLFFHPGRVKRGLVPREELGPTLEEGKSYVLAIDAAWPDVEGAPLTAGVRKEFRVVAPDDVPPNQANWKLVAPAAAGREPLVVRFPEPLDHAMLLRVLRVRTQAGQEIDGEIAVEEGETCWQFVPDEPWPAGEYALVADATLEDRAGNSLGRKFEVDVFNQVDAAPVKETVTLPFTVK